jgi:hypothetical protein
MAEKNFAKITLPRQTRIDNLLKKASQKQLKSMSNKSRRSTAQGGNKNQTIEENSAITSDSINSRFHSHHNRYSHSRSGPIANGSRH